MERKELMGVCQQLFDIINDNDLTNGEAAEVAMNFFCTVITAAGMSLHDTISGVMTYYKSENADY